MYVEQNLIKVYISMRRKNTSMNPTSTWGCPVSISRFPLYEWSSSISTACADARGGRVIYIDIYVNVAEDATGRGFLIHTEEKRKRRISHIHT